MAPTPLSPDHSSAAAAGIEVDGGEGELVEPAGDVALVVEEAGRLARAHGDAEDARIADGEPPSERGDLAVIDDLERHAPFGRQPVEEALDLRFEKASGTARKSEAILTCRRMMIPAEEPPMASTRGR